MQLITLSAVCFGVMDINKSDIIFNHNLLIRYYMLGVDKCMYYSCNNAYYCNSLKGSYDVAKNNNIWCNAMCLCGLR